MKKFVSGFIMAMALFVLFSSHSAQAASTYVKGYYKSNGTYVQGYYRTTPNSTKFDNYSTKGNYNLYTGKIGTVDPYKVPTYTVPKYTVPTYKAPTYTVPKYTVPTYKAPSYKTPSYKLPSYKSYK